jgi:O-antigen/teichoic acid export membrane protein
MPLASSSRARASLRANVIANYSGQLYGALLGLAMVPVYLHWLSAESYGLIGFFALLQSWAQLLDLGLSASISRQAARYAGGSLGSAEFRQLLRTFEMLFWLVGTVLAAALAWRADLIAAYWLHVQRLDALQVQRSIQCMAIGVGARWVSGLYRGVLTALERQVWLNAFTGLVATLRFVAVVPVVMLFDRSIVAFFVFQVVVAAVELCGLWIAAYRAAPAPEGSRTATNWPLIAEAFHFSAWVGLATIVWVFVSQADKLVVSATIPLGEYGFFTAAVGAAGAVSLSSLAVSQALLPRLTQLASAQHREALVALYRRATQLTFAGGAALTLTLAVLAQPILWAWTGDRSLALGYAPVLSLYSVGNLFMLLASFPYSLQHAEGDLRLHVWGNMLFALIMAPILLFLTKQYGAVGAGCAWVGFNASFFFLWTPLVHHRFAPGLHRQWLLGDVVAIGMPPCMVAAVAAVIGIGRTAATGGRVQAAAWALAMLATLTVAAFWRTEDGRARRRAWRSKQRSPGPQIR